MIETKIDATHRLQKDGRWHKASEYRAEQRQKFRDEGCTKKEANEKAWAAMIKAYPEPPDEWSVEYFGKLSERDLPCIDPKTYVFLSVYCNVRATLHRLCPSEMSRVHKPRWYQQTGTSNRFTTRIVRAHRRVVEIRNGASR